MPEHPVPRDRRGQRGFTLLELLVVIAVLGVLSGVAVVAVGRLSSNAVAAACDTDARVLGDAQEAARIIGGAYVDEATLVSSGFVAEPSRLHDVVLIGDRYELVPVGDCADRGELADGSAGGPEPSDASSATPPADAPRVAAERAVPEPGAGRADDATTGDTQRDGQPDAAGTAPVERLRPVEDPAIAPPTRSGGCRTGQVDLNRASRAEMTTVVHLTPGTCRPDRQGAATGAARGPGGRRRAQRGEGRGDRRGGPRLRVTAPRSGAVQRGPSR